MTNKDNYKELLRVQKVINNNLLFALDRSGTEMIVTGKGLGFKRRVGEFIDPDKIEKCYRMGNVEEHKKLQELVKQIPLEHLDFTEKFIADVKKEIKQPINESLLITLADHISFAIQRKEQNIEFTNPLSEAISCYYPTEFHLGLQCIEKIKQEYGIELNQSEAAFVALHIMNAELNTEMSEMHDMTKLLDECVRVTEVFYGQKFDYTSLEFNRFVIHLRYLVQRLYLNCSLKDSTEESDIAFRQIIRRNCKAHYECSCRVAAYIEEHYHRSISEEEKIYLTIHLKRLNITNDGEEIQI